MYQNADQEIEKKNIDLTRGGKFKSVPRLKVSFGIEDL